MKENNMFAKKPTTEPSALSQVIDNLTQVIKDTPPTSPEYAAFVDQLAKLHAIQKDILPERVSRNVLISAGASLGGIVLILAYEHANVITSKALGFVTKPR